MPVSQNSANPVAQIVDMPVPQTTADEIVDMSVPQTILDKAITVLLISENPVAQIVDMLVLQTAVDEIVDMPVPQTIFSTGVLSVIAQQLLVLFGMKADMKGYHDTAKMELEGTLITMTS
eukprot:4824856-Amphidinium_carterae.1